MKDKKYVLNTILAILLAVAVLVCMFVRTFVPAAILPELTIPNMVLLSLAALLVDHYVAYGAARCYICIPVLSFVTFGLLPYAAGFATLADAGRTGIVGAVVFTVITWLFTSIQDRLSTGPKAIAAPFLSALGLYLAGLCFMGMF